MSDDRDEVAQLVRARAAWMCERGHGRWASWHRQADTLAEQVADRDHPSMVVRTRDGRIAGITTLTADTPCLGWTVEEQSEPALFLQSTVTSPHMRGIGVGVFIAFWALDQAFQQDKRWVRRGVLTIGADNRGLLRYYRWQGWRVTRTTRHPRRPEVTVWSLQRPAERQQLVNVDHGVCRVRNSLY